MMNAQTLDVTARGFAADFIRSEASLLDVLVTMRRENAFVVLKFQSLFDYCVRGLKLSPAQGYYFKTIAEKSDSVPELKTAIDDGKLSVSQARRIAPVINPENQAEWIEKASVLPQTELEREVSAVNPRAHIREKIRPVAPTLSELRVGVTPEVEKKLARLKDVLSQKLARAATLADVIEWTCDVTLEKHDPLKKAERASHRTGHTAKPAAPSKPGRRPIPAAVKRIFARPRPMHRTGLLNDKVATLPPPHPRRKGRS